MYCIGRLCQNASKIWRILSGLLSYVAVGKKRILYCICRLQNISCDTVLYSLSRSLIVSNKNIKHATCQREIEDQSQ